MIQVRTANIEKITAYIQQFDTKYKATGIMGFIDTPKGVVVTGDDSVHHEPGPKTDKVNFSLMEILGEGKFTFSALQATFPIEFLEANDLLNEPVPLNEFINATRGSRRRENYKLLLDTLREAGLEV